MLQFCWFLFSNSYIWVFDVGYKEIGEIMKNIIFVFVLTLFLTMSGNVLAHCGNAEAHAKASDHQSHDDTKDKKDKDKDKG